MLPEPVKNRIHTNQDAMLQTLSELIAIPSVAIPQPQDSNFPYGKPCADALQYMLRELHQLGMICKNYDYHMGAADWNPSLPPHLGILCHLDVVPAVASNWSSNPFTAEVRENCIYGRGAIDDKGPAVAVLYALRAIREAGIPLRKNVRFLLGCNEENGSTDLEYYLQKDTMPPQVFTPDGSYPLIHLEKGMLRLTFSKTTFDRIHQFEAGTAPNAVPANASAVLSDGQKQTYSGTAAHASTPETGDNAITGLLAQLTQQGNFPDCAALSKLFPHNCTDGSGLGIACSDEESGTLTCVCSMLQIQHGQIHGCIDIRYPISVTKETVLQQVQNVFAAYGFQCEAQIQSDPHHTPKDTPLVQDLLAVYEEQTGQPGTCIAIGGGTYVHDIPGGVAFGMEYPEWDYHMHGDNEFLPIDQLVQNTEMMAAAILRICQ
ncbi:M20/M25/M40 family metallo-hydrolase [Ruminococcus sp.]|uniref:M20/M25/M40 family metallo-hydrolase n=1 Tax=Ruminococcus sp. TaxID=41978 RepID=UPI0025CFED63|nr:M20/M25/M40 family metallo-hydrolase [Ruminococcus sp.]